MISNLRARARAALDAETAEPDPDTTLGGVPWVQPDACAAGTCDHDDGPTEAEIDAQADIASDERPF